MHCDPPARPSGLRLSLESENDTMSLGRILGEALAEAPEVRAVYLYGGLGCGKTTLVRGLAGALPGGENAEVASPSFTLCNEYPTRPRLLHADLYRLGRNAFLPDEAADDPDEAEDHVLLLLEWAEYLAPRDMAEHRLEIRLSLFPAPEGDQLDIPARSCERKRLADVTGHGEAGETLLQRVRPHLESRFKPCGLKSTPPVSED